MIIIGIVGSPAGGKSTVAMHLAELGATWIHADSIAKSVLDEPKIKQTLINYFGSGVVDQEGKIDRAKLAKVVFGDDEENRRSLRYLESVVHPATRTRIRHLIAAAQGAGCQGIALEVPLMFESRWDLVCDEIWCVDASIERRIEWSQARHWTANDLKSRESKQLPIQTKKQLSNLVIINDGDLNELRAIVSARWTILTKRAFSQDSRHCEQF
ncbi:MAG: dephospho-CoA kinase [Rubripirellula sp.]|nr:dephospho-CoA kinase [Rubripirellula sp.]